MQKFATPTLFLCLSNIYFIYFFFESRITGTRHQERFRNHRILTILSRRIIVKFDRAPIDSVKWASRGNEIQTWSRFAAPAPLVCLQSLSWQMHLRFWPPDYQGGMRLKALLRRLNLSIHRPVPYIYIFHSLRLIQRVKFNHTLLFRQKSRNRRFYNIPTLPELSNATLFLRRIS